MGTCLVKLEDKYFEWSTVVDFPISEPMTLDELRAYVKEEYGAEGLRKLPERLARIERNGGTSWQRDQVSAEDELIYNRAGKGETRLSLDQFRAWCRGEIEIGWDGPTVGEVPFDEDDDE